MLEFVNCPISAPIARPGPPGEAQSPLHPVKTDPAVGIAASETTKSAAYTFVHVPDVLPAEMTQSIPTAATTLLPVPAPLTVS